MRIRLLFLAILLLSVPVVCSAKAAKLSASAYSEPAEAALPPAPKPNKTAELPEISPELNAELETPPPVETEAAQKWKHLKAQVDWVTRLKKQVQGEVNQLNEMRQNLAQAFKLDIKKLEAGLYELEEKSGTIVEKKPTAS